MPDGFRYCIHGKPLSATLYPPRTVLYRRDAAHYEDEGHGHRVRINGSVGSLRSTIDHDDRKPLARWFSSQIKYFRAGRRSSCSLPNREYWPASDRIRARGWILPFLAPVYCLVINGLWRDGIAGLHYTLQRWTAECMIALALAELRCSGGN